MKRISKIKALYKKYKKDPFFVVLLGEKFRNGYFLICSIIPSLLAACMEGISYGSILLAFQVFNGSGIDWESNSLFRVIGYFLKDVSPNRQFLIFLMMALFIQLTRSALIFVSQLMVSRIALRISTKLRNKIYEQIFSFTYPLVSRYSTSNLLQYPNAPDVIPPLLYNLNTALSAIFLVMISFAVMLKINMILSLVTMGIFWCSYYGYKMLMKQFRSFSIGITDKTVHAAGKAFQYIHGIKIVHIFARQETILEGLKKYVKSLAVLNNRINFWQTLVNSLGEIIGVIVISILLVVGVFILHSQTSYMPLLLLFITIAYRTSMRLHFAISSITQVAGQIGSIRRLRKILSNKGKRYISKEGMAITGFNNDIEFKNVSHRYRGRKSHAIENFSFTIKKGQTIALVGKSGAGKSTIVDLILKLYEPVKGKILIDGKDILAYEMTQYRSLFGVVTQDVMMFHDTIAENISFGFENCSLERIENAAKLAGAHEFVEKLPNKYYTFVGERGHRLSGGERQRIALARVLLRNPQILILDEATSQLDSHSEQIIQKAIEKIRKEKTVIIVAHRLSTITNADKILVFDNGKLVEHGHHDELLQKNQQYAYFWLMQSKAKKNKILSQV